MILAQEHTDNDPEANCPEGWDYHRPDVARSNVVYWNPATIRVRKRGANRLSTPGFRSLRYLVWVGADTAAGPMEIASIHLPAFYSSSEANRKEYDRQAAKVAEWVRGSELRVVGGDFNGKTGNRRMRPIDEVLDLSDPVPSGPAGQPIDYVGVAKAGPYRVVGTERMAATNSDHAAVIVTVEGPRR